MTDIDDIKRRAGITEAPDFQAPPSPVNLSHAGRKSKAVLDQISDLMVELEDEIYDIRRVDKKLGEELLKLYKAHDYVALSNLIFRTF